MSSKYNFIGLVYNRSNFNTFVVDSKIVRFTRFLISIEQIHLNETNFIKFEYIFNKLLFDQFLNIIKNYLKEMDFSCMYS